ncbi:hypothetical protein BC938DRAFT_482242 [Jimgerdemannia flammicorona]|uniref:Uncharacterized protein n=1 Tax=Jimgerdemannia flammicorona TaxID=994334 RepID=A0A433QWG9_9FUNG|nr:hypothetical protein BC938DRAFT_482242 [Jimgerdemannia flammicorona]
MAEMRTLSADDASRTISIMLSVDSSYKEEKVPIATSIPYHRLTHRIRRIGNDYIKAILLIFQIREPIADVNGDFGMLKTLGHIGQEEL